MNFKHGHGEPVNITPDSLTQYYINEAATPPSVYIPKSLERGSYNKLSVTMVNLLSKYNIDEFTFGHGKPVNTTPDSINQFYIDAATNDVYLPKSISRGAYSKLSGSMLDLLATGIFDNVNTEQQNANWDSAYAHSLGTGSPHTWAGIDKTISDIADITTKSHTSLTDIGTNSHAAIDSHIADSGIHVPSMTAGSIPFHNGTILTEDNTNLFWDDTNNRLGIGTNAPAKSLEINSATPLRFKSGINYMDIGWSGALLTFTPALGEDIDFNCGLRVDEIFPTGWTAGSVPFMAGSPAKFQEDNANLFWDQANSRLGIGTNTPGSSLEIAGHLTIGDYISTLYNLSIKENVDSGVRFRVDNANNGTSAFSNFYIINSDSNNNIQAIAHSPNYAGTIAGVPRANMALLIAGYTDNFLFGPYNTDAPLILISGTTATERMRIASNGNITIENETLFKDKIKFTQTDGNENIDSLEDGYMDYRATLGHRFQKNVDVSGDLTAGTIQADNGLSGTYTFGGGATGDVASMTFTGGILTGITLVP